MSCFGIDGKPCLNNYGYAVRVTVFNKKNGLIICEEYLDTERKLIAKLYPIAYIAEVGGWAQQNQIVPGSIILKWNEWNFKNGIDNLQLMLDKYRYSQKEIVLVTPDGTIKKYITDEVILGMHIVDYMLEASKIDAIKAKYDKWENE